VVFDRYFDDLRIDPKRYRLGGPLWLVELLRWVVPDPDLVLVLDADENVVFSRKQEVQLTEIQRQRALYRAMKARSVDARIVDASASIAEVEAESARAIFQYLALRLERRHARWLSLEQQTGLPGLNTRY
jgi:thymidylate kinase